MEFCTREGAVYMIHCEHDECGNQGVRYWGESAKTLAIRQRGHAISREKGKEESPLWNHSLIAHGGEQQKFTMDIVSQHEDSLSRLVKEDIVINRQA